MSLVGEWSNSVTVTTSAPPVYGPNPYYDKLAQLGFTWALRSVQNGVWYDHFGNHHGIVFGSPEVTTDPTEIEILNFPANLETVIDTNGTTDYVRVPHHEDLEPDQQITLAWWTQIDGDQAHSWSTHFGKGETAWQLRRNGSNNATNSLRFDLRGGDGGNQDATILGMPVDTRLHLRRLVVATYDGSGSDAMKLWVSNDAGVMTQVATADRSGTIGSSPTSDLIVFAQDHAGTLQHFLSARGAAPSLAPTAITIEQAQEIYDSAFADLGKIIERWDGSAWVPQQIEQWDGSDWNNKIIDDA